MKWKDLSLKERKQIYDSVRVNNPDATYFDIKEQFDSIPTYEDGIMLTNTDKGYVDWKSKLASNLKSETYGYDLYGAYKSGAQQQLEDDGYYHLPTRDPKTNKILKYPSHNTFWLGITEDIKQGYYPQVKDGRTYTVPAYEDGKGKTINKADLPPEYRTGTPEYFERQRKISGAVNAVQPEAYITPAGYIKDAVNFMSYNEIRQSLMDVNPNTYRYLTTPSENKAHMIQLKRGMQKEGLINNWTDPITQDKIEEYLSYRSKYANRVNPVLRTLYDIRPDKQGFINRMNNLTPIEWAVPLGLPVFFGEEQENK